MTEKKMDERSRNLILAAEISGLLHDLGKLRPEFASEGMKGGQNLSDQVEPLGIGAAHGAILEDGSPYPSAEEKSEDWLKQVKKHDEWAKILQLPIEWIIKDGTTQARGLGDPLRQHHAISSTIAGDMPALLGDIYALGADIRDSAFDKGAGNSKSGKQQLECGFIADSFGNELKPYGPKYLYGPWLDAKQVIEDTLLKKDSWHDVPKSRKHFLKAIEDIFRRALGETRRPTNDVTLWHHSYSAASLFKAAVAECVLRNDFTCWQKNNGHFYIERMSRIRFRLLGIRWNWAALAGGALQPVALTALAENRRKAIANLRQRLEVDCPIGNLIYEDDNGAVFVVGGFYKDPTDADGKESEALFQDHVLRLLQSDILQDLAPLGAGVAVRLAWTQPRLYLTDYPEVMASDWSQDSGDRQRLLQVGEEALHRLWVKQTGDGQQVQICPQCGLRPGQARELALNESGLGADDDGSPPAGLCDYCQTLMAKNARKQRGREASNLFGFEPNNFNLQEISKQQNLLGNSRVVMLSVRVNVEAIAKGESLLTQLSRPFSDIDGLLKNIDSIEKAGNLLRDVISELQQTTKNITERISRKNAGGARKLVGDSYWLDFHPQKPENIDFRSENNDLAQKSLDIAKEFFLRESIPDGPDGPVLCRHDGDRLLLFGMRKHASPGRLARTWDDLRTLWKQILWDIAVDTQQWLMPLSLDAGGFRVIVAANDTRKALNLIQQRINETLSKVRAGLDVHVSALAFREKFPLYIALDALRRMERRIAHTPPQEWKLRSKLFYTTLDPLQRQNDRLTLDWDTPQGPAQWLVDLHTGDPNQPDLWYPHAICTSRPEGPGRLVRLDQLEPGEKIRLRPSTFDFMALDGTARRYDLRYDAEGRRPHFILGEPGRRPYLLEQLGELLDLPRQTGWDVSQTKGLLGQIVECYEKWVRDVPAELRADGVEAWRGHCAALLRCYLKEKPGVRDRLITLLQDEEQICLLFDAFEWSGFIEKDVHSRVEESEPA